MVNTLILKMTLYSKKGHYYIFSPNILKRVGKVEEETKTIYCLVSNLIEQADWKKN
jgi:hypothetical protein